MKRIFFIGILLLCIELAFGVAYTIGSGTITQSSSPFHGYYDFSWSKVIFTKAEINTAGLNSSGNIDAIAFHVGNSPTNYLMLDQRIYIRHTSLSMYGAATDETGTGYPNNSGFTQVFQGDIIFNGGGWQEITFDTPFSWNNTNNIEILCENWDGSYSSGYPSFTSTSTSPNYMTVNKFTDNAFPISVGTMDYNRPNVQLGVIDALPNPATLAYPFDGGWAFTDATLAWSSGGGYPQGYDVYLDSVDGTTLVSEHQTGSTYTPTLAAGTTYFWKVIPYNSQGITTGVSTWSFKTPNIEQLAESFESGTFPPLGWSNPGSFSYSMSTPFHEDICTYKYASATPSMLYTPMLSISSNSELNFMARAGSNTGNGRVQIKHSLNGITWSSIGSEIQLPPNTNWNNYSVNLSSLAGQNYYLGFEVYSIGTNLGVYIDHIFGPEITPIVPNAATLVSPIIASYLITDEILSWSPGSSGGIPTSYDVYFGTSSNPPLVINQTGTTYAPNCSPGTTYYWKIEPRNSAGIAINCPIWSFNTPATTQLVESFETSFPPLGWANPGSWVSDITNPKHGSRTAMRAANTTLSILSTPFLSISANSTLDFYYRSSSADGYGQLRIKYSSDRVTWTQIGSTITISSTGWTRAVQSLSLLAGNNYYIAFEAYTTSSSYPQNIYIDRVIGPYLASVAPGIATLSVPSSGASGVFEYPYFSWDPPNTLGIPTGYEIYCDTNPNPVTLIGTTQALAYNASVALAFNTTYYWKVVAVNQYGASTGNTVRSFTTRSNPTIITLPWNENFGTTGATFPPANWTRWSGILSDPSSLATFSSGWVQDNWTNDTGVSPVNWSARMNIYWSYSKYWMISPPIQMLGTGYQLEFDLALTDYSNSNSITSDPNGTTGLDDKFIVLIGNGSSWSTANVKRQWDNTGSTYVYNDIPHTGTHVVLPLDAYNGSFYIAFYGESTISNADNDLFVDNVLVRMNPSPRLVVNPDLLNYGDVPVNASVTKPLTIHNYGGSNLVISSIVSNNDKFVISLPVGSVYPITVASLDSIQINVSFNPDVAQEYLSDLLILSNDPDAASLSVIVEGIAYVLDVDFIASPLSGDIPLVVQFTDQSPGNIVSRIWNFGDGSSSTEMNPIHTYINKGHFDVSLTVYDQLSSASLVRENYIHAIAHPLLDSSESSGINFGVVYLGDSSIRQITLSSCGTDTVFVSNISPNLYPMVFSVSANTPIVIAPGGTALLDLEFLPQGAITYSDSLFIYNSSENSPILKIPLLGIGEYVPPKPPENVAMVMAGFDAVISWDEVTQTIFNTPITPDFYLVFFNGSADPEPDSEYYFLGISPTESYTHQHVGQFSPHMFYRVRAYVNNGNRYMDTMNLGIVKGMPEEEVLKRLK